jgi:hypothetical protein
MKAVFIITRLLVTEGFSQLREGFMHAPPSIFNQLKKTVIKDRGVLPIQQIFLKHV